MTYANSTAPGAPGAPLATSSGRERRVAILGSTGSVGVSTLDLIAHAHAKGDETIKVAALTAHNNAALLVEQARAFHPEFVAIGNEDKLDDVRSALADLPIEVGAGPGAIIEAAERDSAWVMGAIVGAAGLEPTLAAARRGADVALANKECLVCAGDVLMGAIDTAGGALLPVDSEHNAIFQVFDFERPERITRLILTASGGPFRTRTVEEMGDVTPEQAVAHPNWSMGAKISVDSATMMNKGLELIEAAHIFPIPHERIEILVHPQSVIHSMVEYTDGSVLAQLGTPDMRTPIASTLAWPDRMESPSEKLDFAKVATLTFEAPDPVRFPALRLAREAVERGGAFPALLNAANEVAVASFLDRRLAFRDIANTTAHVLEAAAADDWPAHLDTLDEVMRADETGRRLAAEFCKTRAM
ncbi:MAG: 1-deoxy-D-xylulose-5-phosphate reductoisomerase [Pseudomonadota bacterium]